LPSWIRKSHPISLTSILIKIYSLNYWVMHPVARVSINIYIETAYGGFYIYWLRSIGLWR
jgi:hypothetical protein